MKKQPKSVSERQFVFAHKALSTLKSGDSASIDKRDLVITVTKRGSVWDISILWRATQAIYATMAYGKIDSCQRKVLSHIEYVRHRITLYDVNRGNKYGQGVNPLTYDELIPNTYGSNSPTINERKHERISASMNGSVKTRVDHGTRRHNCKYDNANDRSDNFERFTAKCESRGINDYGQICRLWEAKRK